MKKLLFVAALVFIPYTAFAQLEDLGLYEEFVVETSGYDFPVKITATFGVESFEFDRDLKRLSIFFDTDVRENLAEISIPTNLIGGNLTFQLNDVLIEPTILHQGADEAFAVLEFSDKGKYRLDVIGTTYLPEFSTSILVFTIALIGSIVFLRYKSGSIRLQGSF